MNEEYDFTKPDITWKRKDGSEIKFYRSKKSPEKYRAFVNGDPYDPNDILDKATKGLGK